MRIGFYNPYFDSLSGGERYTLTLASHWSKIHDISLFWHDETYCQKAGERFSLDLSRVLVVPNIFSGSIVEKIRASKAYDCIFFLTDGSIPMSFAKKNILHFQVPFPHIQFPAWKQSMYQAIVVNSAFTQRNIDPHVGKKSTVIYPPVPVDLFSKTKKQKTIVSVGRFSSYSQAKKQEILIEAFQRGYEEKKFQGWKLVLLGGLLTTDAPYMHMLMKKADGLPIEFFPNCSFADLQKQYGEASLYWHAAGFGESDPTKMEHFGITTVEAMAAGCIPLVFDAGGQKEIVADGMNGYIWQTTDELIQKTTHIISSVDEQKTLSNAAHTSSGRFSERVFTDAFDDLLSTL